MQKFIRIMAIIATALAGLSLLLILISIPFQRTFAQALSTSDGILDVLPQFPVIPFIFTFLRFGCIALLLICCGKKNGGIWLEIAVFAALVLVLPLANFISSWAYTTTIARLAGSVYIAATSSISTLTSWCSVPLTLAVAIAHAACGMSIVYKKMSK